jgi:type I restriction enzyme M protein
MAAPDRLEAYKLTLDDVIQDPAAGTGGFLISANRYIREHSNPDRWTEAQQASAKRDVGPSCAS